LNAQLILKGEKPMRRLIFCLSTALLAVSALSASALTGKVVDAKGRPIAGAEIYRDGSRMPQMRLFRANTKGRLTLLVPDGPAKMHCSLLVTDKDGKPVSNAKLYLPWPGANGSNAIRSDRRGRFRISGGGPTGWVGIRVRTQGDKPAPKAKLAITYIVQGQSFTNSTTMNNSGEMTEGVARNYSSIPTQVLVTAKGYSYTTAQQKPGTTGPLVVTLQREQRLTGKVVTEKGSPAAGSKVALQGISVSGNDGRYVNVEGWSIGRQNICEAITGKDGRFTLEHLPKSSDYRYGNVELMLTGQNRADIRKSVDLKDLTKTLTITHPSACKVEGILYLPGKTGPAANTQVGVKFKQDNGSETRYSQVDQNGKFAVGGLPPGKATLLLQVEDGRQNMKPREWTMPAKDITVTSAKPLHVELVAVVGAQLKGVVKDKASGKPFPNAQIGISDASRPDDDTGDFMTDQNGAFTARVCAGKVSIMVRSINQQQNGIWFDQGEEPVVTMDVTDGQDKNDVVVEVDPTENRNAVYSMQSKKVPADFQLKPGSYDLTWDSNITNSESDWLGSQMNSKQAKQNISKMPVTKSKKPLFYSPQIDGVGKDGMLCIVMDESGGTGKGYDTAFVDVNRNFDLSDDTPVSWSIGRGRSTSPWITVQAHQGPSDGEHTSNPIQIRLMSYDVQGHDVSMQKKGAWTCVVACTKGDVQFALADMNHNGVYGERMKPANAKDPNSRQPGDYAFVDAVGMGKTFIYPYGPDALQLNEAVKLGARFYKIDANAIGNKVTIAPYDGPMGQLLVQVSNVNGKKATVTNMSISGDMGTYSFDDCKGPIAIPSGSYKVDGCGIVLAAKNKTFQLSCSLNSPAKVEADKQSVVSIGGPIKLAINPEKKVWYLKPGSSADVSWDIRIGSNITVQSLGSSDREPIVNFYNKAGKLVHTTTAGYT
jgi:hypothetical protein